MLFLHALLRSPVFEVLRKLGWQVVRQYRKVNYRDFENRSDDRQQGYFADGVIEDIITELSRFRNLLVITRNSSFAYKGNALGVDGIARELGVQYILEGSCAARGSVCVSPQQKTVWQPRRGVYWAGLSVWVRHGPRTMATGFPVSPQKRT